MNLQLKMVLRSIIDQLFVSFGSTIAHVWFYGNKTHDARVVFFFLIWSVAVCTKQRQVKEMRFPELYGRYSILYI